MSMNFISSIHDDTWQAIVHGDYYVSFQKMLTLTGTLNTLICHPLDFTEADWSTL